MRDVLAQCMREAGHSLVEVEPQFQELSGLSLSLLTRKRMRAAISSAVGFGATSDRRILMLRWCHLLPETMLI